METSGKKLGRQILKQDNAPGLPETFLKTIDHFVPGFWAALAQVPDHRNPLRIGYSIQEELLVGLLLFVLRIGSRRNTKYKLATPAFIQNLQHIGRELYPDTIFPDTLLHGDTLNYLLRGTDPMAIHALRRLAVHSLIRKRVLEPYRLRGMYYPVAIDGTWQLSFTTRHCDHCLTKTHDDKTTYYHPVLEAKLALDNGLALSIGTEFIENERPDVSKQDCELKAFFRLAAQLKADFPQLRICLLLDGLYAAQSVFDLCERYHWAYLITFKEGSMSAVFAEYEALQKLAPTQARQIRQQSSTQTFRWINDIAYESRTLNVLDCLEKTSQGTKRFVWLSSWPLNAANVEELANQGARRRWTIENQGFNVQKNGGYHLEHAYSKNTKAMKNFYLLMQIAHLFNQLMEKGSLLGDRLKVSIGSLQVLSDKLWAAFTETRLNQTALRVLLARSLQIRFNTT